jgi:hypothetical protein
VHPLVWNLIEHDELPQVLDALQRVRDAARLAVAQPGAESLAALQQALAAHDAIWPPI